MTKIFVSVDNERFEATGELLEQLKMAQNEMLAFKKSIEDAAIQSEAAKSSAVAKLISLGLSESEAKSIAGL